jgi:lipopolysaccharide/colanic/teichoic acid biosynthesis glycosyltransferase
MTDSSLETLNVGFDKALQIRLFDLIVSGFSLLLLIPAFVAIGIAIKLSSSGPVFYKAKRVGRGGRSFEMYKFRSMVQGADRNGPAVTIRNDSRVTSVGRLLRRMKLDELPQMINVFKGDMSLVGPRPEDPRYVELYTPEQRQVFSVRPGITGPASYCYRQEETLLQGDNWEKVYCEEILPHKLALDIAYLQHRSWITDVGVIMKTIFMFFKKEQE